MDPTSKVASAVSDDDRLRARERPSGAPIMHQNWGKLLFMHWTIGAEQLRSLIPEPLHIDTFDNNAWVALTPFTMWDVRPFPPLIPAIPGLSSMHELNCRTYVHFDGVPGVWFFSLHINSLVAAVAARNVFHLPYHDAEIGLRQSGNRIDYELSAKDDPPVVFDASWTIGESLPQAEPGSLEFFLTERYVLYTQHDDQLFRARVHHQPWPLRTAGLIQFNSNIFAANQLAPPTGAPLLHYAKEVNVDIWPLESLGQI